MRPITLAGFAWQVSYSGEQGKSTSMHGECAAQHMLQEMKEKDKKRVTDSWVPFQGPCMLGACASVHRLIFNIPELELSRFAQASNGA